MGRPPRGRQLRDPCRARAIRSAHVEILRFAYPAPVPTRIGHRTDPGHGSQGGLRECQRLAPLSHDLAEFSGIANDVLPHKAFPYGKNFEDRRKTFPFGNIMSNIPSIIPCGVARHETGRTAASRCHAWASARCVTAVRDTIEREPYWSYLTDVVTDLGRKSVISADKGGSNDG